MIILPEVKAEYTGFLEKFPDGSIDKKEFKDLIKLVKRVNKLSLKTFFSIQLLPSEDAEEQEGYVFRLFDTSNDGKIDFIEFMVSFSGSVTLS